MHQFRGRQNFTGYEPTAKCAAAIRDDSLLSLFLVDVVRFILIFFCKEPPAHLYIIISTKIMSVILFILATLLM